MTTSKNRTIKGDWRKADARILGQILAAQNIEFALPNTTQIAEFFAELLVTIPGIIACRVCLEDVSILRGKMEGGICAECKSAQKKANGEKESLSFISDFKCGLTDLPGIQFSAIDSLHHHFGFFIFQIDDPDIFNVYKPFIDNLANYVAISLENRLQRDLLQKARDELELRVEERTKELHASNETIQDLYNNAPCGYHSLDKDGFFVLINDTELQWLGYSRDEIVGQVAFRDLLTAASLKLFEENFAVFKERGWVSDLEFEVVRKDGSILPILLNATAITDRDGNYVMSRSTMFDNTERKRNERELIILNRAINQSSDAVFLIDEQLIFVYVNDAACRSLGYTREELLTMGPPDIDAVVTYDMAKDFLNKLFTNGSFPRLESQHKTCDGRIFPVEISFSMVEYGGTKFSLTTVQDITERKRAETDLRKSEERFRSFVENANDIVYTISPNGVFTYVSPNWKELLGHEVNEVEGKLFELFVHPDDLAVCRAVLNQIIVSGEKLYGIEYRVRHKNGSWQWHTSNASVIRDADGGIVSFLGIARDITERKRIEEALRASDARFRAIVESSFDGLMFLNAEGGITYYSPSYARISGYVVQERQGHSAFDLIHPDDRIKVQKAFQELLQKPGGLASIQYRGQGKDGAWLWLEVNARNLLDDPLLQAVVGNVRDITERKQTEDELRRSEEKFRTLIEQSSEGVALVDEEGYIVEWNQANERMTGMKRNETIGLPLWDMMMLIMPPERNTVQRHEAFKSSVLEALHSGESYLFTEPIEAKFYPSSSGEKRYLHQIIFPIKTSKGYRIASLTHDITERKQAEEALHEQERHSQSLLRLSRKLEQAETYSEVLTAAQDEVREIIGYQNLWAYLITEDRKYARALFASGRFEKTIMSEDGTATLSIEGDRMLEEIAEAREIVIVEDAQTDERVNKEIVAALGNRTIINVPIFLFDRHLGSVGTGTFGDEGVRVPTESEQEYLKALASHMAVTLDRIHLLNERRQNEQALRESEEKFRTLVEQSAEGVMLADENGNIVEWNQAYERIIGLKRDQVLGQPLLDIMMKIIAPERATTERLESIKAGLSEALRTGQSDLFTMPTEIGFYPISSGEQRYLHQIIFPIKTEKGYRIASLIEDITERKRMTEAFAAQERKFRTLAENSPDNIARYDVDCRTVYINPSLEKALGHPATEILGTTPMEAAFIGEFRKYHEKVAEVLKTGKEDEIDIILPDKGEGRRYHNIRFVAERGADGAITGVLAIGRDITEHKRAAEAERRLNRELRAISNCNQTLMRAVDEQSLLNDICRIVCEEAGYTMAWVGYAGDDEKTIIPMAWAGEDGNFIANVKRFWADSMEAGSDQAETAIRNGEIIYVQDISTVQRMSPWRDLLLQHGYRSAIALPLKDEKAKVFGVLLIYSEEVSAITTGEIRLLDELAGDLAFGITTLRTRASRQQAEKELRKSEEKYRALADNIPNVVYQCKNDLRYTLLYLNDAVEELTGYPRGDFLEKGLSFFDLYHPDDLAKMPTADANHISLINRGSFHITYRIRHKSGEWRWVDEWGTGITNSKGKVEYLEGVMMDITEQKQHEREREGIITVSAALRQAATRTDILNIILDQLVNLFEADGAVLVLPNIQNGGLIDEMGRGAVGERMAGLVIPHGKGICNWVITHKTPYLNNHADQDPLFYRPDLLGDSHCIACAPLVTQEQAIGALWVARQKEFIENDLRLLNAIADIAANAIHRVMLYEQTEQQVHHLIALHQIDIAISSNFDLNLTFDVILNNVKNELEVDAVDILLLTPITHTLDYAAGLGFRTRGIEQSHVKLVDGQAGVAAREYRTVSSPDLKLAGESFSRSSLLADEGFTAHFATPLVVKGQVKGVLELFSRKTIVPESDWIDYFETLATQAAIAIESASLMESLQRSNAELKIAYDATIEGWSRALDLRDKETEGHTQRVTEMALKLAEKMGMSDTEKQHLWRGSLLHDIGKMGIPDSILLKPGPLSEAEKEIMQQHPTYAYQMLSPISYLKPALDVSYCHHEKWDGSGYPRGLKGEEIPLSARLFAVVDVFDALTTDRPYRKAWSHEEVYRYIEGQAGKHFDPKIVRIFLENNL